MGDNSSVDFLFKEHSFEEIESVRDNLANEIEKRTDLLKSIVKEKYRDIVDTSDAIHSMKLNLKKVEESLWALDENINQFYRRLEEPEIERTQAYQVESSGDDPKPDEEQSEFQDPSKDKNIFEKLLLNTSSIWDLFNSGDIGSSIRKIDESMNLIEKNRPAGGSEAAEAFENVAITLYRAKAMIRNHFWHLVQTASQDEIGVIAGCEHEDMFKLSLESSIQHLTIKLNDGISDTSFTAQIKRYQPNSFFKIQTSGIDPSASEIISSADHIQIPKLISPELHEFLYGVCKIINTIAGFKLNRDLIILSLSAVIERIIEVYSKTVPKVDSLKTEAKRKRSMQLYFDILYIRILLNTSRNLQLIERLDPKVTELAHQYERMLDTIELYMISDGFHANVVTLSQSTIRLFGLLIPHLQ